MKNLFHFETIKSSNGCSEGGSPRLVPGGGTGLLSTLSKNFLKLDSIRKNTNGVIDVINDFHWTSSQKSSRQDIPFIQLKEKRLRTNSLYAQMSYYALVLSDRGGEVGGRMKNLLSNSKLGSGLLGDVINGVLNNTGIGKNILGIGNKILGSISNFGSGVLGSGLVELATGKSPKEFINQLAFGGGTSGANGTLTPYEGLYLTEDTNFEYHFPYFSNTANAVANAFSDDDALMGKGVLGAGIQKVRSALETVAYTTAQATGGIMEPGVYIEKPKFYQFGNNGDTITLSFPLINTGWATFEDVQRNWQLIYMLIYQNRPNRKSRDLIDPPCLYEVSIPGVKYMPYSFISKLQVDFLGSRRSYYINIPNKNGGMTKIRTIIPDAYMISISITGLVAETQNFLYHMLFEEQNKVNIFDSNDGRNPFNAFINGLVKGVEL